MKIEINEKLKDDKFAQYKKAVFKFTIKESILKQHFKDLMRISTHYSKNEKTGYICTKEKENFLELVEKIEKSDSVKCKKSHQKSIQKKLEKNQKISNRMSFEDFCEEFLDQDIELMSEEHKNEAYQTYITH